MENALRGVLCYKGERGLSAYEVAVQNGFKGDEKTWLAQLGTSSHFSEDKVVIIATANQSSFDIPESYVTGSLIDVYVEGRKLTVEEYSVDEKINLVGFELDEGAVVEIVTKLMGTNEITFKHYNNVSNMKLDTTLKVADLVETTGYYEANDGGAATYLIREKTDSDIEDNGSVHFLENGLVAELIVEDCVNVKQFGAKGDGVTDDTEAIQVAVNCGKNINFTKATYKITNTIEITKNIEIDFNGSVILSSAINETFLCKGKLKGTTTLSTDYDGKATPLILNVADTSNMVENDLLVITSETNFNNERSYYKKGGVVVVNEINGNDVKVNYNIPYGIEIGSIVKVYEPITAKIKNLVLEGYNELQTSGNNDKKTTSQNNGIVILNGANCEIVNTKTNNFLTNIDIIQCFNTTIRNVTTLKALPVDGTQGVDWDAYGLKVTASNTTKVKDSCFISGQHGATYSNSGDYPETCYDIEFKNCIFSSEVSNRGFGAHHNAINVFFDRCLFNGCMFANNTVVKNSKLITNGNYIDLYYGDDYKYYNFLFENCDFSTDSTIGQVRISRASFEGVTLLDNAIDYITFINCKNFKVRTNTLTEQNLQGTTPVINCLNIIDCKNAIILHSDYTLKKIHYKNSNTVFDDNIIKLDSNVELVEILNSTIGARYRNLYFGSTTENIIIRDVNMIDTDYTGSKTLEIANANAYVLIDNLHSTLEDYSLVVPESGCNLNLVKSKLNCYRFNFSIFAGKHLLVDNSQISDNKENINVVESKNGQHFYVDISESGSPTYTAIA